MENNEANPTPNATPAANLAPTPPPAPSPAAPSGTATPPPPAGGSQPALYNPNVASSLSVFFSPIFGSWCCHHNYRALGLPDKAKRSQIWMVVSLVYLALSLFVPGVGKGWLIFLVVWYYCDGRKQAQYLKENNVAYEKKNWLKPVLVAAGALVLLVSAFVFSAQDKLASRGGNAPTSGDSPTIASADAWKRALKTPRDERVYEVADEYYRVYVCDDRVGWGQDFWSNSKRKRGSDFIVFDLAELRKALDKASEWDQTLEAKNVSDTVKKKICDISLGVGYSELADEQANLRAKFAYAEEHAVNVALEFERKGHRYQINIILNDLSGSIDDYRAKPIRQLISPENIAKVIKEDKEKRARTEDLLK